MSTPHVALIIETSSIYGRNILRGIVRYMRTHDEWSIFLEQRDIISKPPTWIFDWKGDGIISRTTTPELAECAKKSRIPFIELTDRGADFGFPMIHSDDESIGRLAAEHFLERGYQNFAFCGFKGEVWSERRGKTFGRMIEDMNLHFSHFESGWYDLNVDPWEQEQKNLIEWLHGLPRPAGIFACNDIRGHHILDACRIANINVPEEIAVIGVDDDDLLCQLAKPPLSSVIPNAEAIGYKAAESLSLLMSGQTVANQVVLVPPVGITTRQSSDHTAIDDPDLAKAIHMIRERACQGMTVNDVLSQISLSRSSLERRMRKYLRRSPQQEIRHIQLKRATRLLRETEMSIESIARSCGFENPEYMHVVFRREFRMTPGDYRRQAKT